VPITEDFLFNGPYATYYAITGTLVSTSRACYVIADVTTGTEWILPTNTFVSRRPVAI
jgi:hypothetical protein